MFSRCALPLAVSVGLLLSPAAAPAATLYVDAASAAPAMPYATLATAAHSIQEAIEAAADGDRILVAPGTYAAGSTLVDGQATRVAITKALTVESLQGAAVTTIQGAGPVGSAAIRGVYVGENAVLQGFTITGGATALVGDLLLQRSGGGVRCAATGEVRNCVINNNRATHGGGGVVGGTLTACTVISNFASTFGGGAWQATLQRCQISFNNGGSGGGAAASVLSDCLLNNNLGPVSGGGAHGSTLTNCTVTANSTNSNGTAGGVRDCATRNSIVYGNTPAGSTANWVGGTFERSCTTPLPAGAGNISADPLLQPANGYRISLASPCRDAGDNAMASSVLDLYGNARMAQGTIDLGAHELNLLVTTTADAGVGSLRQTVADFAGSPETPVITFANSLAGQTIVLASAIVRNQTAGLVLDATGLAAAPVLRAAPGVRLFQLTKGALTLRGLRLTGTTPPDPGGGALYQTGGTAIIEDCQLDGHSARSGGAILVENASQLNVSRCTFTGNRCSTANTGSNGGGAIAFFSVGTASIADSLFQDNSAEAFGNPSWAGWGGAIDFGGGTWSVTRCTFRGNTADLGGALANIGAIEQGAVTASTFEGNTARRYGGGIFSGDPLTLTRCTLQGNTAPQGGAINNNNGALALVHCTVSGNTGTFQGGICNEQGASLTLAYSIVSGNAPNDLIQGSGSSSTLIGANIVTNALFEPPPGGTGTRLAVPAGLGPLGSYGGPTKTMPLAADSPAREAGAGSPSLSDQRAYPTVGLPDLGAYEGGTHSDYLVWIYEKLPAAATLAEHDAAFDFDGDGQTNFEEWLALTEPNRGGSRFTASVHLEDGAPTVSFLSAPGRVYRLQQSDTLLGWSDAPIAPLAGDGSVRSFVLPAPGVAKRFFRVSAGLP